MRILSVDLGHARTGVAISDDSETLAYPLCVIFEHNEELLVAKLADTIKENKADLVVLGLPKNMDNTEGDSARFVRNIADRLSTLIDCAIVFSDERVSTVLAHNYLNDNNVRGKRRKKVVDAVAATIILQSFLDLRRNKNIQKVNNQNE